MTTNRDIIVQEMNEERFNRKHIDTKIRVFIDGDADMQAKLQQGVQLVQQYMGTVYSYESKNARIAQMKDMDVPALVMDMFVGIAYCLRPELFTSVSAQMASRLKLSDRKEAITTVAEIIAVLCQTDAFDIEKPNKMASLMVVSRIPLPDALIEFIENSQYLPPMVCEPLELVHNFSSGYLTHNDSLILGSGNHHDGDICLDVLNTIGKVALSLDTTFLSTVEETSEDITVDKVIEKALEKGKILSHAQALERVRLGLENWDNFKQKSYMFYLLMATQGNRFFLNHKVDKRGRIYASGYHITTQGAPFKKAMLEFADAELIGGVP